MTRAIRSSGWEVSHTRHVLNDLSHIPSSSVRRSLKTKVNAGIGRVLGQQKKDDMHSLGSQESIGKRTWESGLARCGGILVASILVPHLAVLRGLFSAGDGTQGCCM